MATPELQCGFRRCVHIREGSAYKSKAPIKTVTFKICRKHLEAFKCKVKWWEGWMFALAAYFQHLFCFPAYYASMLRGCLYCYVYEPYEEYCFNTHTKKMKSVTVAKQLA